jgi:hypothetical protein
MNWRMDNLNLSKLNIGEIYDKLSIHFKFRLEWTVLMTILCNSLNTFFQLILFAKEKLHKVF